MTILAMVLGGVAGLLLGLLGGGGSILTVPVFVYVLGFPARDAIAMSLAVVGTVSLFGAAGHWRAGNVNVRVALVFGAVAMVGTYLGARLAAYVSGAAQLILFAVVMLAAAFFMFRPAPLNEDRDGEPGGHVALLPVAAQAVGVGVLTGLVGVGGGFLIVPALVLLARVPMKQAVGTSLLVITMSSAAGFAGYLGRAEIAWGVMAPFALVAIGGIVVGTRLVHHVPQATLRRAFAVFLVVVATLILYQNRGAVLPHHGRPAPATAGSEH